MKSNKFWNTYKYDIISLGLYVIFWNVLIIWYDIEMTHWQFWVIMIISALYRGVGYAEGRKIERTSNAKNLVDYPLDICVTIPNQKIYKLGNIANGTFFSIVNDVNEIKEPLDKYVKTDRTIDVVIAYNMTQRKTEILLNTDKVVLYSCKSIYTPKIEKKEDE